MPTDKPSVSVFEPHIVGHAHFQYSSSLARAIAASSEGAFEIDLLTVRNAFADRTGPAEYHLRPVIDAPTPLQQYRSRVFGALDRCIHWRRADREVLEWVESHPSTVGVHYQETYGFSTLMGVRKLQRRGVAAILTVHNITPHVVRPFQNARLEEAKRACVYRTFDALIVHSEGLRDSLQNLLGPTAPPVYVIPHGVGESLAPGGRYLLPERMREKRLLFVGSPRPNKGLCNLLKAMPELSSFSLTVAGFHSIDSAREEALRTLTSRCQQDGAEITIMPGYISDQQLDEAFRQHSVVVLPYTGFSSQSGVLSRAIAYRTPLVVTDVGALGETVRRLQIGVVVKPGSPGEISAGVRRLYQMDPDRLQRNLEHAAAAWSWPNIAAATIEVYNRVFQLPCPSRSRTCPVTRHTETAPISSRHGANMEPQA